MEHNQINEENEEVTSLFMNKCELRCPTCGNIMVISKGADVENAQCSECRCVVGDHESDKNSINFGGIV